MSREPRPTRQPRERMVVCGVVFPDQPVEQAGPLSELRGLLGAAGAEVVGEGIVQRAARPVASTLMGRGKAEEVAEVVRREKPDAVAVDNDLSPGQLRNLEKLFGTRVLDRTEIILDIFARRARTRQARLQVELAQVQYLFPRLRRMWTHLERTEGAIGTRGPGETQLETDRRLLRKRITDLRRELAGIEARRRREVRSRAEQFTVGLVGYTNAGKSTLLNRLTGSEELVADMLFATLDTRTRQWRLPDGRVVLLSDTVGFLQRLPHHLVASFHATLEETLHADLLLHVVDASHPDAATHVEAVDAVLAELSTSHGADVLVLNKLDNVDPEASRPVLPQGRAREVVRISARTGEGLDRLAALVARHLDARSPLVDVTLPLADGRLAAAARRLGRVEREDVVADDTLLRLRLRIAEGALGHLRRLADGATVGIDVIEPAREPLLSAD